MYVDKMIGDRWQKWWSRMCHMVFDATLLVDTQEYRVLNAWGEERVFGCQIQSNHPLLYLIHPDDAVSLKEAFNEVTFKGFERGRTLHLVRPSDRKEMPAQCFLLSADQENPNECMMGIRMQGFGPTDTDRPALWDVTKENPVLTLEDLARVKSGLKGDRRANPRRTGNRLRTHRQPSVQSKNTHASSKSLSSIPEDIHGESEHDDHYPRSSYRSSLSARGSNFRSESMLASLGASLCSDQDQDQDESMGSDSESKSSINSSAQSEGSEANSAVGVCNSDVSPMSDSGVVDQTDDVIYGSDLSPKQKHAIGPPIVRLRWMKNCWDLDLRDMSSFEGLREHVHQLCGVPHHRQTLILAGCRLTDPPEDEADLFWSELQKTIKPGQTLMLVGKGSPPPSKTSDELQSKKSSDAAKTSEKGDSNKASDEPARFLDDPDPPGSSDEPQDENNAVHGDNVEPEDAKVPEGPSSSGCR